VQTIQSYWLRQLPLSNTPSSAESHRLDLPDIFARFQRWAVSEPRDIGLQTEAVLTDGTPWDLAAGIHFQVTGHAAGNGSLMRAATSAVFFAGQGSVATMEAARRIAALTHGDRAAWEGTAVFHELVRRALDGADPLAALPDVIELIHPDHRDRYAVVLGASWHPDQATEFNGAVWPCLGSAVWALRTTTSYENAVRAAIDLVPVPLQVHPRAAPRETAEVVIPPAARAREPPWRCPADPPPCS
jgi:ADP-ribosylglycohydrolase